MAYHCEEQMSRQTLLSYIHQNRLHNSLRINTIGEISNEIAIFIIISPLGSSAWVNAPDFDTDCFRYIGFKVEF